MVPVGRSPAGDGHGRADQADHQPGYRHGPGPVRGQGVQQNQDGHVGVVRLEREDRLGPAVLHAEGNLQGADHGGDGERRHRVAAAR